MHLYHKWSSNAQKQDTFEQQNIIRKVRNEAVVGRAVSEDRVRPVGGLEDQRNRPS